MLQSSDLRKAMVRNLTLDGAFDTVDHFAVSKIARTCADVFFATVHNAASSDTIRVFVSAFGIGIKPFSAEAWGNQQGAMEMYNAILPFAKIMAPRLDVVPYALHGHTRLDESVGDVNPLVGFGDDRSRSSDRKCFQNGGVITLPAPVATKVGGVRKKTEKDYQLTLRVSDEFHAYMLDLQDRVRAETLSQLVRWAVAAMERVLDDGFVLRRSDGVDVGGRAGYLSSDAATQTSGATAHVHTGSKRVNIAMNSGERGQVKGLVDKTGFTLVGVIETALGVLDALIANDGEVAIADAQASP